MIYPQLATLPMFHPLIDGMSLSLIYNLPGIACYPSLQCERMGGNAGDHVTLCCWGGCNPLEGRGGWTGRPLCPAEAAGGTGQASGFALEK